MRSLFHYSFLDGRLIGSEYPGAIGNAHRVIQDILGGDHGVMVTLTPAFRKYDCSGLSQVHCPMVAPDRPRVEAAVLLVHQHLAAGRVWVHCQRGLDRTACVIGAYLVLTGHSADQVIDRLISKLPGSWRDPRLMARLPQLWKPYTFIRQFEGQTLADLPAVTMAAPLPSAGRPL